MGGTSGTYRHRGLDTFAPVSAQRCPSPKFPALSDADESKPMRILLARLRSNDNDFSADGERVPGSRAMRCEKALPYPPYSLFAIGELTPPHRGVRVHGRPTPGAIDRMLRASVGGVRVGRGRDPKAVHFPIDIRLTSPGGPTGDRRCSQPRSPYRQGRRRHPACLRERRL